MKDEILSEIEECMVRCDTGELVMNVERLLTVTDEEDASKELGVLLYKRYTTYKEESTAALMATIISVNPNLALLKFPENFLFRIAMLRGSVALYECYIEEAIEPYLEGKSEDDTQDCYSELYTTAELLTETFFPKYVKCIKGMDFNSAFLPDDDDNGNLLFINKEDFELMDEVVEKYNTIVGRRDIVKDLSDRMSQV